MSTEKQNPRRPRWLSRLVGRLPWVYWRLHYEREKRERLRMADEKWTLKEELRLATIGRCTCSGCGRTVNNAWRDSDGHHCLTCLATQRDKAREALSPNTELSNAGPAGREQKDGVSPGVALQ